MSSEETKAEKDLSQSEEQIIKLKQRMGSRWITGSVVLMVLFLVVTVTSVVAWVMSTHARYLVLLDAGSVHTTVYTYRYSYSGPGSVSVKETNNCDIGTSGISSFKSDPVGAAKFVAKHPCLLNSIYQIPQSSRAQSSIDLVSTAGMRIIRLADPIIAGEMIGNLTQQLQLLANKTAPGMTASAAIMEGEDEALAGWVTAVKLTDGEPGKTVAALDWGGASAQITFPVDSDFDGPKTTVVFNNVSYDVSAESFICYGQAESRKRHEARLVYQYLQKNNLTQEIPPKTLIVSNPCLPDLSNMTTTTISNVFESPCTELMDRELMKRIRSSDANVTFTYDFDYNLCSELVYTQFDSETCESTWHALKGEHKCLDPRKIVSPPQELTYLAMSTYWYLARGLGLNPNETGVTPHFSLSQFLDATEKLCNLPATDERLKKLEENAPSACYQCLLMYHLLTDGFHFDEKSWDQLHVAKRLNGMELGWGLGRAILHSDMTVEGPEYISFTSLVILLVLGAVLLLLSLWAAFKGKQAKNYTPLREMM